MEWVANAEESMLAAESILEAGSQEKQGKVMERVVLGQIS